MRGEQTDEPVIKKLTDFNDRVLGKGVVRCGDTPGFLGNRVGVYALQLPCMKLSLQAFRLIQLMRWWAVRLGSQNGRVWAL